MQLAEKKVNFIYLHDDMLWQAQVYAMSLCLCLSVHLSHVGVLLKQLNVELHKQNYTIAQGFQLAERRTGLSALAELLGHKSSNKFMPVWCFCGKNCILLSFSKKIVPCLHVLNCACCVQFHFPITTEAELQTLEQRIANKADYEALV